MGRDEQFIRWIKSQPLVGGKYPAIAGGSPEGEGEGEGNPAGGEGGNGGEGESEGGGDPKGKGGGEEEHEIDVSGMEPSEIGKRLGKAEAENQRLKREKAEREKEMRKQQAQAKAQEDQRKAEQGEWKKLAEERADRILDLEREIKDLKDANIERDRKSLVEKVADKLNFRNPRRAYALLKEDMDEEKLSETLENEQLTEAALRRLAKDEPYLVDSTRRTGAGMNGRGGGPKDPAKAHNELVAGLLGGGAVPIDD